VLATSANATTPREVINGYADLAFAKYSDSLDAAVILDAALKALIDAPSTQNHQAAKDAWLAARVPYQQTEAFRFGNAYVDAWEGKVNAWPNLHSKMIARLAATMDAMQIMKDRADNGVEAYDQMIGFGNDKGNAIVQDAIDGLIAQTRVIEELVTALGAGEIGVEGSDSLDNPTAVFQ